MLSGQPTQTLGQAEVYREGDLHCRPDYWRRQLSGSTPLLELPADRPRQAGRAPSIARLPHALPDTLARALVSSSERAGVPLFVTLLAAFQALIYRYTDQEDIIVGVPAALGGKAGAAQPPASVDTVLPVRADFSGRPTFRALLSQVSRTVSEGEAQGELTLDQIVDILGAGRGSGHAPLQVLFACQELPSAARGAAPQGAMASFVSDSGNVATLPDLALAVADCAGELTCAWEYNAALFEAATIGRMAGHFETLLAGVVADPAQPLARLPLLTDAEREQILVAWNANALPIPPVAGMHQLFEAQAARTSDAVAVIDDEQHLTYAQLERRANRLAHLLRAHGIGPETLVTVALDRTLDVPVALLGILKAGGAYVPLDPAYPPNHLGFILADTQAPLLITQSHLRAQLPPFDGTVLCLDTAALAAWPASPLPYSGAAAQTAYLIYTSGSTGRPKGVVIAHQSALALLAWAPTAFTPAELAGVLAATSLCFDLSIFELFVPLSLGGTIILAQNALALPDLAARHAVTLVNTVPSALAALLRSDALPSAIRTVNLAGEALPRALVAQIHARLPDARLCNLYGPSEDTTYSTWAEMARDDERVPPIGRPLCNTQVYLLDRHAQPVPVGALGEVYLGGAGLARGYLGRPDLTAERFVPNPFADHRPPTTDQRPTTTEDRETRGQGDKETKGRGNLQSLISNLQSRDRLETQHSTLNTQNSRLYRTGDLARYRADGQLEFVGRIDHQVKLRGHRIELGEIESGLRRHPAVQEVVVVRREDVVGQAQLVAYVVPTTDHRPPTNDQRQGDKETRGQRDKKTEQSAIYNLQSAIDESNGQRTTDNRQLAHELRGFLKERLPDYMVPSAFVMLARLPMTTNGKLDRRALPPPRHDRYQSGGVGGEPRDSVELQLTQLWEELLNIRPISITDDFFALGGHSLLAVHLMARIKNVFGSDLPLSILFQGGTIEQLARSIRQQSDNLPRSPLVGIQPRGSRRPFFCVHPIGGNVLCYARLAHHLGSHQPFYGIQAVGLLGQQTAHTRIEDMAAAYIDALRAVQAEGPYLLGGWSMGGVVAFEMAQQLHRQGHEVGLLALLDSYAPNPAESIIDDDMDLAISFAGDLAGLSMQELPIAYDDFRQRDQDEQLLYLLDMAKAANIVPADTDPRWIKRLFEIFKANMYALRSYTPSIYPNRIALFRAAMDACDPTLGWSALSSEPVAIQNIPGDHYGLLAEPNVRILAEQLTHVFESLSR
jgi:amino acid adenylation domain-containing protein